MFKSANVNPLITVCIPVYETERFLLQCLESVYKQDFASFEILLVSDASPGRDQKGRKAKKLIKIAEKECKQYRKAKQLPPVKFRFIEHKENRGILEVRRTMYFEAKGRYVASLDSDDEFTENALSSMYDAAGNNDADIVHATFVSGTYDDEGKFTPSKEGK